MFSKRDGERDMTQRINDPSQANLQSLMLFIYNRIKNYSSVTENDRFLTLNIISFVQKKK